jgi:hypothetical protein
MRWLSAKAFLRGSRSLAAFERPGAARPGLRRKTKARAAESSGGSLVRRTKPENNVGNAVKGEQDRESVP